MKKGENMKHRFLATYTGQTVLILILTFLLVYPAAAIEYNLTAGSKTITMPDGTSVTMWGFGLTGGDITIPGPTLRIPPGDSTVTINLTNSLSVPVSVVIPSLPGALSPVTFTDSRGRTRVRSFTHETAPGNTSTYTWTGVAPGTYVYQSGTHVAIQVQMGLYGSVIKDHADHEAYQGKTYDKELIIFLSDIDPALHSAVANGTFGTAVYPSTIDYAPKYFLINGQPYPNATLSSNPPIGTSDTVLLRFLNAGLITYVPSIPELYISIIGEDAHLYPYPNTKYSVFLPAGKSKDAIARFPVAKRYPLYDRRFHLTNNQVSPGGMLAYVEVVEPCVGDINGDHNVDAADLIMLAIDFGRTDCSDANPCQGDFNSDGRVDLLDLALFASNFGRTDCP